MNFIWMSQKTSLSPSAKTRLMGFYWWWKQSMNFVYDKNSYFWKCPVVTGLFKSICREILPGKYTITNRSLKNIFVHQEWFSGNRFNFDMQETAKFTVRRWNKCVCDKHALLREKMRERSKKKNLVREAHWRRKRIKELEKKLRCVEGKLAKWKKKKRKAVRGVS